MSLRTKSSVWEFFIRCPNGEDKMVCKLCNSILSGRNASNAKKHLRYSHRSDYEKVVGQDRANNKKQVDDQPIEHSCSTLLENLAGNNKQGTILDMNITNQERDLLIWLSKPSTPLCTLVTDDCKRFIRNFDKNFDFPKRRDHVVSKIYRYARYTRTLVESHIKSSMSRFAVTVNIWQIDGITSVFVSLNFINKRFEPKRVFLGSALLNIETTLDQIKSKVYSILSSYNIDDSKISAFVTNGPHNFMAEFKKYYDETCKILNEDDFLNSCSTLGNFTDENDDLTVEHGLELPSDTFVNFPQAQHQMSQLFGPKHVFSLELQLEYVMTSRIGLDPLVLEVLYLVEKFQHNPDFVSQLLSHSARAIMVSLKPNWKCHFFSAKRTLEICPFINKVAEEKQLPTLSEKQMEYIAAYVELLEPFINLACSANPENMLNEVYGIIQSLIFHCTRIMERNGPISQKAEDVRTQLKITFHDVLNSNAKGVNYVAASLFNPNQAYLVDLDRQRQVECIRSNYEARKLPTFVKQEQAETTSEDRSETFEEFMLKKRRIEESARRSALHNEATNMSGVQLAEFYLNLTSMRPANCNLLEFWANVPVDLDPLVSLALDYAAIPSSVTIFEFLPTLALYPNPTKADVQFFSVRSFIFMNKHMLIEQ